MLNLDPLLLASPAIQIHVVTAMVAAVAGLVILLAAKGTALHRLLGRVFVLAMAATALSSFLIHEIRLFGPFSMIHLLSIFVLLSLVRASSGNLQSSRAIPLISLPTFIHLSSCQCTR